MTRKTIAALCATMLLAACVDEEELQPEPKPPSLEGAWTSCKTEDNMPQDEWETFLFTGDHMQRVQFEYESNDGSCTGRAWAEVENVWEWDLTFGPDFETTFAGELVTARTWDVSGVHYNILYVDAPPEPGVLYIGDPMLDPTKDGSSPEARPTVLMESRPYRRHAASAIDAAALAGRWGTGCVQNVAGDTTEVFEFLGHTLTVIRETYESMDGTCTGTATPSGFAAALALRDPVTATLDGGTVTARQVDMADGGRDGFAAYSILYVDTAATPNVLYVGELGTTAATRPNVLGLGPQHVRQ